MKFQFKTSATMKPYNCKRWWIDSGIVREITVEADDMEKALGRYREIVSDDYGIRISKNAMDTKEPMYRDTAAGESLQVGYVITGKTDFNDDYRGWVAQYIDLWVSVSVVMNPFEGV